MEESVLSLKTTTTTRHLFFYFQIVHRY